MNNFFSYLRLLLLATSGMLLLCIEEFYKLKYCSTVVYMVPRA